MAIGNNGAVEVSYSNFFETKLASILASGSSGTTGTTTLLTAPTGNSGSAILAPFYLVIDPDNPNKEIVEVTAISGTSITIRHDIEGRHNSGTPDHTSDTVVRMAVVKEMFEDIHDRIDALPTNDSTDTLTNKTMSGSSNTFTNLPASQVLINNATDGTGITVDSAADMLLLYDADTGNVVRVYSNQVGGAGGVSLTSATGFFLLNG